MNMYNPFNTTACTSQGLRMSEAQQHLIKAFVRLMAKKDGRKQRWAGTKTCHFPMDGTTCMHQFPSLDTAKP